jgi:bifunctional ADP-heptose synthase (sugar kinase/adenylyltransferase)
MQDKLNSLTDSETTPQQKQFKVLLIGDSCIDRYVYGVCERLNPESPVPLLKYESEERIDGMCWNVRHNLDAFGVDVHVRTNDPYDIFKSRFIDTRYGQQILRVDRDLNHKSLSIDDLPDSGNEYDVLVISDYDKGYISSELLFYMAEHFDGPVFIDSKKAELPVDFDNVTIKINDKEYSKLKNKESSNIIVTKGPEGAEYQGKLYPAEKVKLDTFHVCGAGDTFFAALVYFYLETGSVEEAIPYANKAAAIAVSKFGTYTLNQEDIDEIRR